MKTPSAQAALQALKSIEMEIDNTGWRDHIPRSQLKQFAALRQFIEGAERDRVDAERWRWMREQVKTRPALTKAQAMLWNCSPQRSRLDEAVDAARSAEQKGKT